MRKSGFLPRRSAGHLNIARPLSLLILSIIIVVRKTYAQKYEMSSVHAVCTPINWLKDSQKYDYFFPACLLDTLCINHTPRSPVTKAIKTHVCSATNPTASPKKPTMAPTTLSAMASNALTAFSASLLSASANLYNHFFKAPLFLGGGPPPPPPPPKSPMAESTTVAIPVKMVVSAEIISTICS